MTVNTVKLSTRCSSVPIIMHNLNIKICTFVWKTCILLEFIISLFTHYWIKLIIHTHSNYNLKPLWTRLSKQFNRCNTLVVASTHYLFSLCFKLFKGSPLSQRSYLALNRIILCLGNGVSRTELGLELLSPEMQLYTAMTKNNIVYKKVDYMSSVGCHRVKYNNFSPLLKHIFKANKCMMFPMSNRVKWVWSQYWPNYSSLWCYALIEQP